MASGSIPPPDVARLDDPILTTMGDPCAGGRLISANHANGGFGAHRSSIGSSIRPITSRSTSKGFVRDRYLFALTTLGLLLAGCGTPVAEEATTTTELAVTTSTQIPATTTSPATTTTSESTTTTEPATSELGTLMASLQKAQAELTSARIQGSIEMTGMNEEVTGLSEVVILFSTAFDTVSGDASFLMDMSSLADSVDLQDLESSEDPFAGMAAAFLGEIEFRKIGDRVFLKFPFFTAMFGAETDWISMPADEGDQFTNSLETVPSDPNEILQAYEGAAGSVESLGTETVNGVDTTHYRISLNAEEMELTGEERAELEASGLFADGIIPMEIWVSDEGYTIRMVLEIDGTGIEAPPEEQFGTMRMVYDMFDINRPVVIEPPPASEVTDVEDLEGSLFGFSPDE